MENEFGIEATIPGRFSDLSVNVNGVIIPGRPVERTLGSYVFNLVVYNDDDVFKVSLVGSATAVRYRGREFLLASQHQLRGSELSRVAMLADTGSHIITAGGVRFYEQRPDTDANDIMAFDFTEPCKERPELKRRFFNLVQLPPDVLSADVIAILLSGYPSDAQLYELEEKNHIGIARLNVICTPEGQPADECLLTVKALRNLEISPDGMSGGSAFVIQMIGRRPYAYLAGIILRGGKSSFRVLKIGVIKRFLDSFLGSCPEAAGPVAAS